MKRFEIRPALLSCVLSIVTMVMVAACAKAADNSTTSPSATSGGGAGGTAGVATGAMKFQTYSLQDDPTAIGGEVSHMLIPAGWKSQGGMVYDFTCFYPAQVNLRFDDPNSSAGYSIYPSSYFISGDNLPFPPGANYGGSIVATPVADPFEAIKQIVIPKFRPDLASATIVETEPLPKLADMALQALPAPAGVQTRVQAGRMRFEYSVNDKPVQEDFYVVFREEMMAGFELWNVDQVVSIRADKGNLDQVKQIHDVTMRSIKPSLAWFNKYCQFISWRQQNTMAAIRSAGEFSQQIAAENDAVSDDIRQQYENQQAAEDRISEARSEEMREETPWDAGDGQKVLLPADYGHAWRDGNGQYLVSNDPNYDPNTDPNNNNATWTSMNALQQ